jgi:hypothetical protein
MLQGSPLSSGNEHLPSLSSSLADSLAAGRLLLPRVEISGGVDTFSGITDPAVVAALFAALGGMATFFYVWSSRIAAESESRRRAALDIVKEFHSVASYRDMRAPAYGLIRNWKHERDGMSHAWLIVAYIWFDSEAGHDVLEAAALLPGMNARVDGASLRPSQSLTLLLQFFIGVSDSLAEGLASDSLLRESLKPSFEWFWPYVRDFEAELKRSALRARNSRRMLRQLIRELREQAIFEEKAVSDFVEQHGHYPALQQAIKEHPILKAIEDCAKRVELCRSEQLLSTAQANEASRRLASAVERISSAYGPAGLVTPSIARGDRQALLAGLEQIRCYVPNNEKQLRQLGKMLFTPSQYAYKSWECLRNRWS